jgi:hypothetical protein
MPSMATTPGTADQARHDAKVGYGIERGLMPIRKVGSGMVVSVKEPRGAGGSPGTHPMSATLSR